MHRSCDCCKVRQSMSGGTNLKAGGFKCCKNAGLFSAAMARMPSRGLRLVFARSQFLDTGFDWQAMGPGLNAIVMGR